MNNYLVIVRCVSLFLIYSSMYYFPYTWMSPSVFTIKYAHWLAMSEYPELSIVNSNMRLSLGCHNILRY